MTDNTDLIDIEALIRQQTNALCGIGVSVDGSTLIRALRQSQQRIRDLECDVDARFANSDHLSAKYYARMQKAQRALVVAEHRNTELEADRDVWKRRCAAETLAWTESVKERDALAATLDAVRKLADEAEAVPVHVGGGNLVDRRRMVGAAELDAILDSSSVSPQHERDAKKPTRLDPELRADFIEAARARIEEVWADVGPTTAQTLAENIMAAQEFFYLSHQVPIRTEQGEQA